jgi:hypothetical protein
MAITNYTELQTAISNWLQRSDLTARITEFIALGESRLFTELRCREMETATTFNTVGAQATVALPTRFCGQRYIYVDAASETRLEFKTLNEYYSVYGNLTSASPIVFSISVDNYLFGPVPDNIYAIKGTHYARPDALSSTATNDVLSRWPGLYLYSSLLEAAPFLGNDPRIVTWSGLYETLLERAHAADRLDRGSGDVIIPERQSQIMGYGL